METTKELPAERAELDAVLSSDTFAKSPNLARLLKYVCTKYFEGRAADLKEYNIGVEAMGRPADFDPATNSIVRVEVHRLREKLKKYYETEGADRPVTIALEVGHYVPQFIPRKNGARKEANNGASTSVIPLTPPGAPVAPHEKPTKAGGLEASGQRSGGGSEAPAVAQEWIRKGRVVILLIALGVVIAGSLVFWHRRPTTLQTPGAAHPEEQASAQAPGEDQAVRILAGYSRGIYIDRGGKVWGKDRYYTGGVVGTQARQFIDRAPDPTPFETFRYGDFAYDIPLGKGTYELRLYFVETYYGPGTPFGGGEGSRVFDVDMNGKPLLSNFDIMRDAGSNRTADARVFKDITPAPDGFLHLKFRRVGDEPIVNALEIVPGIPGQLRPIRIVARDSSYTDGAGWVWLPDNYFSGGRLATHKGPVEGTSDPDLYSSERFGNFSYAIPVAKGKYTLTLRFAETYFGPNNPGGGGEGSRVFDVYSNGVALLRNFDIYKEASGENRALVKTFRDLEPNALGKLVLAFVPVHNYACVDAIEIVDQGDR